MTDREQQLSLMETDGHPKADEPVECLGLVFAHDADRRAYFTDLLRVKLQDSAFRQIEGFPLGEDEDILNLSDPPYYTACPNPWIADFVALWESQKPERPDGYRYHREPFAADVSEGKNDPIYNAHSYHTKVPHKAIMRYILHYTEPGDIVFDGFCGTGMTGVAAQMCGDRDSVMSLGYQVKDDGTVLRQESDTKGNLFWIPFSKLGARQAVLNDLSPSATCIAHKFNTSVDEYEFRAEASSILDQVEQEYGWMYLTRHTDGRPGNINFTLWSDVFVCPECAGDLVFWEVAVDKSEGCVRDSFLCPHCRSTLTKRTVERSWITKFDSSLSTTVRQAKQVPVLINYTIAGKRYEKEPDAEDLNVIEKIDNTEISHWHPTTPVPSGDKTGEPIRIGLTHVNHFYTRRNLISLSCLSHLINSKGDGSSHLIQWFTSSQVWGTKQNRLLTSNYFKKRGGVIGQTLQGTLYISSLSIETNLIERFRLRIASVPFSARGGSAVVETTSATHRNMEMENSIDYVFIDPPFGSNLMYSELNLLWESWLRVQTSNLEEAIENRTQNKGLDEYRDLMTKAFSTIFAQLKPGHWMTVEFSNTSAGIWNGIQTAISNAGFIVANVSALQKTHNGFNAVTNPTSVRQDLVISAYKPNGGFEERFLGEAQTEEGVWDFIHTHLQYLRVTKRRDGILQTIPERDPRILFDQMVAYYVRKGYPVPISSQEFQLGLAQRFSERDGMYFLPDQVVEYDRSRMTSGQLQQLSIFVSDEASAIQWLRQQLAAKPQTFQDLHPNFMRELGGWQKHEKSLELTELLEQNFLRYDGVGPVPSQVHSYLSTNYKDLRNLDKDHPDLRAKAKDRWYVPDPNKAADLEKLRERALLREFQEYREAKQKRLKVFRLEAVRAGFKQAWQDRDYATIIEVGQKIPDNVLQEDPKLLMWLSTAETRSETSQ